MRQKRGRDEESTDSHVHLHFLKVFYNACDLSSSFRRFQLSLFLTCNGYLYRRNQIAGKFNLTALLLSFHWQHLPMSSLQQISTHILKTNLCSPTEDLRSGPSKWVHLAATNSFWPALTNKKNIITHIHIMSSIFNSELPAQ